MVPLIEFGEFYPYLEPLKRYQSRMFDRVTALEHLQDLIHAPSVQMHDVPRESLGHHLGFVRDEQGWDELDERLARKVPIYSPTQILMYSISEHARYVYNLQESSSASSDSDGEESWDSDDSSSSWRRQSNGRSRSSVAGKSIRNGSTANGSGNNGSRKRMSLLTNRYFDVPVQENGFGHFECGAPLGKNVKRKFFNYPEKWDDVNGGLTMRDAFSPLSKAYQLAGLMERGGRDKEADTVDEDWDDNNSSMAVDS